MQACAFLVIAVIATGCDRAQLLAPTTSTITVSAATQVLQLSGNTEVTAFVLEQAGTPVQNGTVVRFTTTLGRLDPVEAQTRNDLAATRFYAGESSGAAQVRATSGGALGAGGTATTPGAGNVVTITIGAAAAARLSLTATPSSVSSSGGTSQITATVFDGSGNALSNIPVSFSTDAGTLSASSASTGIAGQATITLTTNRTAKVTARAGVTGTGTSAPPAATADVTVSVNVQGTATLTCSGIAAAAASCSQLIGATVTFTAIRTVTANAAPVTSARLEFGEGPSVALGTLASSATVNHVYQSAGTYTATLTATDANGETSTASVTVVITARPTLTATLAATPGTSVATVGNTTSFTATVTPATGGADMVESYTWHFGDDSDDVTTSGNITTHVYRTNGPKVATVTVRTTDGRTATARAEFIISGI